MYCPYCGNEVNESMSFCPYCGKALSTTVVSTSTTTDLSSLSLSSKAVDVGGDYSVVLVSQGDCSKSYAADLLEDLLNYSESQSEKLIDKMPTEIAQELSYEQAQAVAQVLTEYGLKVAIYDSDDYVTTSTATTAAVQEDGSLAEKVLSILGTISLANQVKKIVKWSKPRPVEYVYRPSYRWYYPPVHTRRVVREVEPEPRKEVRKLSRKVENNRPHTVDQGGHGGGHGPGGRR